MGVRTEVSRFCFSTADLPGGLYRFLFDFICGISHHVDQEITGKEIYTLKDEGLYNYGI